MEQALCPELPVIDKIKCGNGYVFRFLFAFIFLLGAAGTLIVGVVLVGIGLYEYEKLLITILLSVGSGLAAIATLTFIGAVKGRTSKRANIISIVIGAIFCVGLIGILGVVGGVRGKHALENPETDGSARKISNADDVARYRTQRYAAKASAVWGGMFILGSLVYAPFFTIGLFKYKKRFKVFFAFYLVFIIIAITAFVIFALSVVDSNFFDLQGISYGSFIEIAATIMSVMFGLAGINLFCSLFSMMALTHPNIYVKAVEKEVQALGGNDELEKFRRELLEKSKAKDVDGFIAQISTVHERYESCKDFIIDESQFNERLVEKTAVIAANDGEEKAKAFKTQCKALFDAHEFEMLAAVFDSGVLPEMPEPLEGTSAVTATPVGNNAAPVQYIAPKTSERTKKAIMIAMSVMYALLLIIGILVAAVPSVSGKVISGMGICNELTDYAYAVTIGVFMVALVPSVGYYFGMVAPLNIDKKIKAIILAVAAGLSVIMTIVFFVVINCAPVEDMPIPPVEYFEGSDSWFVPTSMVFAQLGLVVCYALLLFKINPDKINDVKPTKEGDKIWEIMKHVLSLIAYGVVKLVKSLLKFKESRPEIFILVVTVLFTWLAFFTSFIVAIIITVVLVAVIVMMFCKLVDFGYTPSAPRKTYIAEDEYGQKFEIEENPYEVGDSRYEKVYYDQSGNRWVGEDKEIRRNE